LEQRARPAADDRREPGGGRDSLRVLENLSRERIVRELGDARDQRNWW
jgi:hypothetical protein